MATALSAWEGENQVYRARIPALVSLTFQAAVSLGRVHEAGIIRFVALPGSLLVPAFFSLLIYVYR